MFGYILFIIRCVTSKFKYFTLSAPKKASFLLNCGLIFEAGYVYMKHGYYTDALSCFLSCDAYRHALYTYEKLGKIKEAIALAKAHQLYKEGAKLCIRHHEHHKAAYFYRHFDPEQAILIYKQLGASYELGICYLISSQLTLAHDCFKRCDDLSKRKKGLRHLEEVAIVLYLSHNYIDSMNLFIKLKDYYSALECAKKLRDKETQTYLRHTISKEAFSSGNYEEAAAAIAPIDRPLARLYHHLTHHTEDFIPLALYKKNYYLALHMCFAHNDIRLARYITQVWLSEDMSYSFSA